MIAHTPTRNESLIGRVRHTSGLNTESLDLYDAHLAALLSVDHDAWLGEVALIEEHYDRFGDKLPTELRDQLLDLEKRLAAG